jgi:hypothetical protein
VFNRHPYLTISLLLLAAILYGRATGDYKYPESMTVRETPIQREDPYLEPFVFKEFTIKPFAQFSVKALVLSANRYFWGRAGRLVPVDLALGWGPMSDGNVLKYLKISQGNRWYFYRYRELPIPEGEIIAHSANMHLIAATPEIARKIKRARRGDIIELRGYLVNVTAEDGWYWNSSHSRTDTRDGSCELVWVEEFDIMEQ